ncbi:MAG: thiol reductase thioredoxin [Flavobacteriales bacterium]|jgi:thioredoxin 1|nr:thiol reductase thioredoxin [Flavobacteriales bacterium]|tara:strand:- start:207 stop:464 length:258 start_codon:yes stop_codon:yes gene_type:complete
MDKGILYFSAPWCGPCKVMSPLVEQMEKQGKIRVKKVNVDYDASLPAKYNIKNVPTMVLTDLNGNEISRKIGQMNEQQILDFYNG